MGASKMLIYPSLIWLGLFFTIIAECSNSFLAFSSIVASNDDRITYLHLQPHLIAIDIDYISGCTAKLENDSIMSFHGYNSFLMVVRDMQLVYPVNFFPEEASEAEKSLMLIKMKPDLQGTFELREGDIILLMIGKKAISSNDQEDTVDDEHNESEDRTVEEEDPSLLMVSVLTGLAEFSHSGTQLHSIIRSLSDDFSIVGTIYRPCSDGKPDLKVVEKPQIFDESDYSIILGKPQYSDIPEGLELKHGEKWISITIPHRKIIAEIEIEQNKMQAEYHYENGGRLIILRGLGIVNREERYLKGSNESSTEQIELGDIILFVIPLSESVNDDTTNIINLAGCFYGLQIDDIEGNFKKIIEQHGRDYFVAVSVIDKVSKANSEHDAVVINISDSSDHKDEGVEDNEARDKGNSRKRKRSTSPHSAQKKKKIE